jgi:hypothetical protein
MTRRLRVISFIMICLLCTLGNVSADEDENYENAIPCTDCGLKTGELALLDMIKISTGPGLSMVPEDEIEGDWAFFCDDSGYDGGYDGGYGPGFIGTGSAGGYGMPIDILMNGLKSIPGWNTPRTNYPKKPISSSPVSAHPDTYLPQPSGTTCVYGMCDCSTYARDCPRASIPGSSVPAEWRRACCGSFTWNPGFR